MTVLVTDGQQRPALTIVRSLGRRGLAVLVGAERQRSLASSSRYCTGHVTYPSPERQPEAFRRFLLDFAERERVDVIIPVTDVTTRAISLNQRELGRHSRMAVPRFEAFEFVTNKSSLVRAAADCGIPVPRTHHVDGIGGLRDVIEHVEYPAVIKPTRSRILADHGWIHGGVHYAVSELELRRVYRETDYLTSSPSLIQERIVGPGVGVFVLFDRGELLAAFAHRRLREKPPAGGVSVLRESIPLEPRLRDQAVRLLGSCGWHGVAMLEYKQDHRTGEFFLMEVNGRFWGSLQLAVDAGVDFPYLTYQLALGQRPDVADRYGIGVRSRWLLGDLDHLLARLLDGDRALHLPDGAPSRLTTIVDFLKFASPDLHYEVISAVDPRPFLYELRQYVGDLTASAARRFTRPFARTRPAAQRVVRPPVPL